MRRVKMSILQYDSNYQYDPIFQYQKILKDIHKNEHNIVLSVSNDKAEKMRKLTEYDNYLIASLSFLIRCKENISDFFLIAIIMLWDDRKVANVWPDVCLNHLLGA
ncbi:unnamed protein product, partial [Medioppia subpectinata]